MQKSWSLFFYQWQNYLISFNSSYAGSPKNYQILKLLNINYIDSLDFFALVIPDYSRISCQLEFAFKLRF